MKTLLLSTVALLLCGGSAISLPTSSKVTGDYVEVRTASVFAGACHYNGELVTTGRDAIMAWNFTSGSWNGVDLSGLRAVAAVSSDANLSQERAVRKIELVIDSNATDAQASALAGVLKDKCTSKIGQIASIRRAPITFDHADRQYTVKADGFAAMSVRPMPNNECCAQPNLVWYTPLSPIEHRKVGFTQTATYTAGTVGDTWQREGENSAFYGSFSF